MIQKKVLNVSPETLLEPSSAGEPCGAAVAARAESSGSAWRRPSSQVASSEPLGDCADVCVLKAWAHPEDVMLGETSPAQGRKSCPTPLTGGTGGGRCGAQKRGGGCEALGGGRVPVRCGQFPLGRPSSGDERRKQPRALRGPSVPRRRARNRGYGSALCRVCFNRSMCVSCECLVCRVGRVACSLSPRLCRSVGPDALFQKEQQAEPGIWYLVVARLAPPGPGLARGPGPSP